MSEETTAPASTESTSPVENSGTGAATEQTQTYGGGKYESVSALEQGYSELQKSYSSKLGKFTGSPEAGYSVSNEEMKSNDALAEWGKDNNLSNDGYNQIIESQHAAKAQRHAEFNQAQMKALGENADYRLQNIRDFAVANLGEGGFDTVDAMIKDAKGVEMFETMIKKMSASSNAPAEVKASAKSSESVKEMRFAIDKNSGQRRMAMDPAYAALVRAEEAKLTN